jgi:hypothetical protein
MSARRSVEDLLAAKDIDVIVNLTIPTRISL